MQWKAEWTVACVAGVCATVYATPLLLGNWDFIVCWDDDVNFAQNGAIRHLDWHHVRAMLAEVRIGVYEPLAHFLKAIVFAACGLNSQAVRLVSLMLHVVSCLILRATSIRLLAFTTKSFDTTSMSVGCTISAVLYGIHPLNVEVVAWPSAQPYTLAQFFTSSCLYVHVVNRTSGNTGLARHVMPTVLYGCAVLSKSVAVLTPVGLVLIDVLVHIVKIDSNKLTFRSLVLQFLQAFAGFGIVGLMAIWTMVMSNQGGDSWEADPLHIPFHERLVKVFVMLTCALQMWLWPTELRAHYQLRPGDMNIPNNAASLLSVASCVGITMWCVCAVSTHPGMLAAWVYYVVMFLPVCGLVQHGIITLTADRYAYFPTVVFIPVLGACIAHGIQSARMSLAWFAIVAMVLAMLSANQVNSWRNDEVLWLHNIQHDPSDWRALDHLADYYAKVGRVAESAPYWERSLVHTPRTGLKAKLQEARLLMFLGRYERGCALYDLELRQFPGSTHLLNNMGVCYMHMRKYDLAKQSFQRAIDYGLGLSGKHGADTETPQVNLKQLEGWDGQANYHAHLMW
ncbi:hypothetical protein H257_04335 [Aphanomyces astaci]|uniref:Uncharacterized protein n=1 Tax=Aphanomyces astaci TaxID=112090 RepID=W4GXM5_APHAT|nr:hypothetical protein H257_04335 [Aphanomyces astaci]ETV83653.1 hypothetical protein H257_04335 [Aphanomyces astaci]|eukprot:XP_009827083.1 hypothetical protein H257_04335 [Aphanomyces astaci]